MKKLTLILLLIGLLSGSAYASLEQEPTDSNGTKVEPIVATEKNDSSAVAQDNSEAVEKEMIGEDGVEDVKEISVEEEKDDEFISETTMYYTFSTIAQTLAGAFGILGAFVMYRLQSIKQSNSLIGKRIIDSKHNYTEHLQDLLKPYIYQNWNKFYNNLYKREDDNIDLDELEEMFRKAEDERDERLANSCLQKRCNFFYHCYNINKDELIHLLKTLKQNLETKKDVVARIRKSLSVTVFAISLSLVALPLCPFLCSLNNPIFITIVTAIALSCSVVCLQTYSMLIIIALGVGKKKMTVV